MVCGKMLAVEEKPRKGFRLGLAARVLFNRGVGQLTMEAIWASRPGRHHIDLPAAAERGQLLPPMRNGRHTEQPSRRRGSNWRPQP
jgi:hypothetical protein